MKCRNCKKEFKEWHIRHVETNQVYLSFICKECAKPDLDSGRYTMLHGKV